MSKQDLKSLPLPQLTDWLASLGEPRYRAAQLFSWLHEKCATDVAQMTNLPASLQAKLEDTGYINSIKIKKKLVSEVDGTVKYLYELRDGNQIETVLMHYHHAHSLCISTQVGCRMGCRFCASTLGGLVRSLTASEMLDQIYATQQDADLRIGSVVLMGIGEPLDNFDNVLNFLDLISDPKGQNLSLRHVTLSTCGLVDQIRELATHKLGLTLSVSLHAPNDTLRTATMPVNKRWPVADVIAACKDYFARTGRRVTFEYALIDGANDQPGQARELAGLLKGFPCHVNLIPVNTVAETGYRRSKVESVRRFQQTLESCGIPATVRRELGSDIAAACGQLRLREMHETH